MSRQKFHKHHGKNIKLLEDETVAYRQLSFAHGITFSAEPLHPREMFLIEVEKNERGWSGHLRIGLTQLDPNDNFDLPFYALPDLLHVDLKKDSWIFAVTAMHCRFSEANRYQPRFHGDGNDSTSNRYNYSTPSPQTPLNADSILGDGDYIQTYQGSISRKILRAFPHQKSVNSSNQDRLQDDNDDLFQDFQDEIDASNNISNNQSNNDHPVNSPTNNHNTPCTSLNNNNTNNSPANVILPTDVGSRIGIMYVIKGDFAEMHFILNGEDLGAWAKDISYKKHPLYAVVDVYGTTKQVKVIQLCCVSSLQNACRRTILACVNTDDDINLLPIPNTIKDYLKFAVM